MNGRGSLESPWYQELPWAFGLAWLAGMFSVFPWIAAALPSSIPLEAQLFISELIPASALAALLTATQTWRRSLGALRPRRASLHIVSLAFLPLVLTAASRPHQGSAFSWPASIALALVVGLYEEVFYRGFLLEAFRRSSNRGILWSAAFFGLAHARNLAYVPSPTGVVVQIVFATGIGLLNAAVRIRSDVLWPLVLVHTTLDLVVLAGLVEGPALAGPSDLTVWVGGGILFAVLGLLISRFEPDLPATEPQAGAD